MKYLMFFSFFLFSENNTFGLNCSLSIFFILYAWLNYFKVQTFFMKGVFYWIRVQQNIIFEKGEKGVGQFLIFFSQGGKGVGQFLVLDWQGGEGVVWNPPFLTEIISKQAPNNTRFVLNMIFDLSMAGFGLNMTGFVKHIIKCVLNMTKLIW